MATTSTPLSQSESGREFLQRRVARFGLFGAAISWGFLAFRVLSAAVAGHMEAVVTTDAVLHYLACSLLRSPATWSRW